MLAFQVPASLLRARVETVNRLCSFLPLIGPITTLLLNIERRKYHQQHLSTLMLGSNAVDHVELAMVLAVDGSASVTYEEFGLIAGGMATALRDTAVAAGLIGSSVLALLLWSGSGQQDIITDWSVIDDNAGLTIFADSVDNMPRTVKAGATAIGEALLVSLTMLARIPAVPKRNVVNVIGDGRSNDGIAPGPIRDRMAAADITINGLCILHEEPDLLTSYANEVIGGPGAFAVTCREYKDFTEAMRQKLTREIKGPIA